MANHKAYMHKSFPSVQDNEQTPHLKHLHAGMKGHEDPHLHPHEGGDGKGTSTYSGEGEV
jgi:hypothetical protein